jgi:hypothetical protein
MSRPCHEHGRAAREDERVAYLPYVVSALLLAVLAVSARRQAVYGSIAGSVTDENGVGISDATVTITSVEGTRPTRFRRTTRERT